MNVHELAEKVAAETDRAEASGLSPTEWLNALSDGLGDTTEGLPQPINYQACYINGLIAGMVLARDEGV